MKRKNNYGWLVALLILVIITATIIVLNYTVPAFHDVLVKIGDFFSKLWTDFINLFKK